MQILTTSGGTINFIPREKIESSNTYEIIITSESENKQIFSDRDALFPEAQYYNSYTLSTTLKEGEFYTINITSSTNSFSIFRDKIFCTDQAVGSFEINNGVYTSHASNNEFIYYE